MADEERNVAHEARDERPEGDRPEEPRDRYPVLRYFAVAHLPGHLQLVSRPFAELAYQMAHDLPPGPEVAVGLRKLLEAKDAFVRAALL
jgi:hypothetical protein